MAKGKGLETYRNIITSQKPTDKNFVDKCPYNKLIGNHLILN